MKQVFLVAAAVIIGFAGITAIRGGGVAPMPEVFADASPLEAALARSAETGKPVLALATADWCGPCQMLKRDTLTDPEVAGWIEANTIPVYLDVDKRPEEAKALRVSGIPDTVLLRDGEVIARSSGYAAASDYLGFLRGAVE